MLSTEYWNLGLFEDMNGLSALPFASVRRVGEQVQLDGQDQRVAADLAGVELARGLVEQLLVDRPRSRHRPEG